MTWPANSVLLDFECYVKWDVIIGSLNWLLIELNSRILTLAPLPSDPKTLTAPQEISHAGNMAVHEISPYVKFEKPSTSFQFHSSDSLEVFSSLLSSLPTTGISAQKRQKLKSFKYKCKLICKIINLSWHKEFVCVCVFICVCLCMRACV